MIRCLLEEKLHDPGLGLQVAYTESAGIKVDMDICRVRVPFRRHPVSISRRTAATDVCDACRLVAVFVLSILESLFTALHGRSDYLADFWLVDRACTCELAIATFVQVQMANELGGAVHNDIGIVAGENELPVLLGIVKLVGQFRDDAVIQIPLGLINDQRPSGLLEQHEQQGGCALSL